MREGPAKRVAHEVGGRRGINRLSVKEGDGEGRKRKERRVKCVEAACVEAVLNDAQGREGQSVIASLERIDAEEVAERHSLGRNAETAELFEKKAFVLHGGEPLALGEHRFEIRIGREHRMAGGRDDAVVDLKERLLDERGKFCSLRKSRS